MAAFQTKCLDVFYLLFSNLEHPQEWWCHSSSPRAVPTFKCSWAEHWNQQEFFHWHFTWAWAKLLQNGSRPRSMLAKGSSLCALPQIPHVRTCTFYTFPESLPLISLLFYSRFSPLFKAKELEEIFIRFLALPTQIFFLWYKDMRTKDGGIMNKEF